MTELGTNSVTSLLEKLLINCQLPLNIQSTRLQLHQNITWFGPLLHVPTKACVTHYTKVKRYIICIILRLLITLVFLWTWHFSLKKPCVMFFKLQKKSNMRKKNKQISWITGRCRLRRCLDGLGAAHRGLLGSWRPHLADQISWSPRLVGCLNDTCQDLTTQGTMLPLSFCSNIQRRCKGCFLANLTEVFQCFFMCRIFATTRCWIIACQCRALWLYNAE